MRVGLDIGSTTIKCVVLNEQDQVVFDMYERHGSHVVQKAQELLLRLAREQLAGKPAFFRFCGYGPCGRMWCALCTGGICHPSGR